MKITSSSLVTLLAFFIAASQVIEVQLPLLPLSIEELGIVLTALLLLAVGFPFRLSALLVILFAIEFTTDSIYAIAHGNIGRVIFALLSNGALFVAFSALHEKLVQDPPRFVRALALAWIGLAAVSSILIILQFIGVFPKVAMVQGAVKVFPRPPGLQNDPNYAAYSIAIAMLFLCVMRMKPGRKLFLGSVFLLATICTESRMGIVLILIIWGYFWMSGWSSIRAGQVVTRVTLLLFIAFGGVGVSLASANSNVQLLQRFERVAETLETISIEELSRSKGYQGESSRERLLLAYGGLMVWQENVWIGVGHARVVEEIRRIVRVGKATHNGYIDRLAIGGIQPLADDPSTGPDQARRPRAAAVV